MTRLIENGRRVRGASNLSSHQQSLAVGGKVFLFKLDLAPIGVASQFYFTPSGKNVVFNGQAYTQAPVQLTDIERNASGENPEPKLTIPNMDKFASGLVTAYADLVGATVSRTVTYEKFLDDGELPDPTAIVHYDVFVIEQKAQMNKLMAQFSLRVLADVGEKVLPARLALRDICSWNYRRWNGTAFVYPDVRPCPYNVTGTGSMFTLDNVATVDPALDDCFKDLPACNARPWPNGKLGYGGFPGMVRLTLT